MQNWAFIVPILIPVVVRAANGFTPDAVQTFAIDVVTDQSPSCSITAPTDGATVFGTDSDFFGNANDDVGIDRVEFFVDGDLKYTATSGNPFFFGGSQHMWDTTALANGPHQLRMVCYDTANQSDEQNISVNIDNMNTPQEIRIKDCSVSFATHNFTEDFAIYFGLPFVILFVRVRRRALVQF